MTIDEAINQLKAGSVQANFKQSYKLAEAMELSIEALKVLPEYRRRLMSVEWGLLPGETDK